MPWIERRPGGVPRLRHQPALEGVRALAVIVVMVRHVELAVLSDSGQMLGGGTVGVAVFFALSGFLITALLVREIDTTGTVGLGSFQKRRALRLVPNMLAVILATVLVGWLLEDVWYGREAAWSVTYLANYGQIYDDSLGPLNHLWTLAFEQHFYLVWPIALAVATRYLGLRRALVLTLGAAVAVACWRSSLWSGGSSLDRVRLGTDTRLDGVLLGCAAALVWARYRVRVPGLVAAAAAGYLVWELFVAPSDSAVVPWGYAAMGLAASVVVLYLVESEGASARALSWKPLVFVGTLSYGLYLWHYPTYSFLVPRLRDLPTLAQALIAMAVSAVLAYGAYRLIEQPFLRRKSRG